LEITKTILRNLVHNEDYFRKVYPYLKDDYFSDPADRIIFSLIKLHIEKYNQRPTQQVLDVELENTSLANQETHGKCKVLIANLTQDDQDLVWLTDTTEEFCKEKAIYNGLLESLDILKSNKKGYGSIVSTLEDAIAVSFDTHVGHDWSDDADARFEFYHATEFKVPFDIDILNKITGGGVSQKSLTIWMGGVGMGKTATMCHFAAVNMLAGKKVLYITGEMAEERIAERIDANLLDTKLDDLRMMPKDVYDRKIARVREKTAGKLIIKEYPTGAANVAHFRHLLHELKYKKRFIPDIIYIDYLNIFCSTRIGLSAGLYSFVKSIAEEIRGLAVEMSIPIVTATQLNREGFADSDPDMTHTSESWGTPMTADLVLLLISNKELSDLNQILVKQIKNRYSDVNKTPRFIVGRDLDKMRLYDVDNHAKIDNGPVINLTAEKFKSVANNKINKEKFSDFKFDS
jgi:replicative DNA helicase